MNHGSRQVLVCGDVNVDMIMRFSKEGLRRLPDISMMGGGTGGNTAVGLSRLGCGVRFAGKVGADLYGRQAAEELDREGVDISCIAFDEKHPTAMVLAFIDEEGDKHNATWPEKGAAHTRFRREEISQAIWSQTAWCHSTGINLWEEPTRETTLSVMEEARARGIPVSFDLNLRLEFFGRNGSLGNSAERAIALSDYLFGSAEEELIPLTGERNPEAAAQAVAAMGPTVIARLGAGGALCVRGRSSASGVSGGLDAAAGLTSGPLSSELRGTTGKANEPIFSPAFRIPVTDTLGAGDAFNSGFIASMLEDSSIEHALTRGHACAGWKIMREGARSLPTRTELLEFAETAPRSTL